MKIIRKSKKHKDIFEYKNTRGTFWGYRLKYYDDNDKRREVKQLRLSSEREAFEHLIEKQSEINKGLLKNNTDITVSEWYQRHIEMNKPDEHGLNGKWSYNTYINRQNVLDNYVKPLIGDIKLENLTLLTYQTLFIDEVKKELSAPTIELYHKFLSISLNSAVRNKLITENPIKEVTLPEDKQVREDKFINVDELQTVLKDIKDNDNITNYTVVKFLAFTGMRIGELRALKWKYISFDKKHIKAYANMTKYRYGLTKGKKKRIIPVDHSVMDLLSEYKKWCVKRNSGILNEEDFVFITPQTGRVIAENSLNYALQRSNKRTGLNVKPHTLRHTHSAILIMQNRSLKAISKRLGNTEEVLNQHYGHVIDSVDVDTMNAFSEALNPKTGAETGADSEVVSFKR